MSRRLTHLTPQDIIAAAKYANFGDDGVVNAVCTGLLQISSGFRTGGTVTSILKDLKLIGIKSGKPTKLGKLFLYDLVIETDFAKRFESNVKNQGEKP